MQKQSLAVSDVERGACPVSIPERRVDVEHVRDVCRLDAETLAQLAPRALVDDGVAPRRVVGRQLGDRFEARSLPRRIVMMEDRRPPAQHLRDDPRRCEVHRDREQVLDDDEVEAIECFFHLGDERLDGRVDRETGHQPVDWPIASDRRDVEAEVSERLLPALGYHRHAVGPPESKRDEGSGGHVKVLPMQ